VRVTYLGVEKPKKNDDGEQETCPHVDGFDSKVGTVGTDHVRDGPLEDNADGQGKCSECVLRYTLGDSQSDSIEE